MKLKLPLDEAQAEAFLPDRKSDGSGVGINYADALLKPVKLTLEDGRKLAFKRRGLKITLTIGDKSGEGLLRRLENGPDVREMLRAALKDAARNAGASLAIGDEGFSLEVPATPEGDSGR
jgi:hypothetical protein